MERLELSQPKLLEPKPSASTNSATPVMFNIELLFNLSNKKSQTVKPIPDFEFGDVHTKTNMLLAKEIYGKQYLMSPDYSFIQEVENSSIDFGGI